MLIYSLPRFFRIKKNLLTGKPGATREDIVFLKAFSSKAAKKFLTECRCDNIIVFVVEKDEKSY
jgi:hypothetical protein